MVTVLTESRTLFRLLLEDLVVVVVLPGDLVVRAVVLMFLLALVVVGSVVTRIVGALRMNEGSVGLARVVCLGNRTVLDGCLLDFEKRFVNLGSEKLLFRGPSGCDVVELTSTLAGCPSSGSPESSPSSSFLPSDPMSPAIWLMTQETMSKMRRCVKWGKTRICSEMRDRL